MKPEVWVALIIGVVTIGAIILGPILALKIQRRLDEEREVKARKLWVLKTLMSFRATRLNPNFVQALNLIEIEFRDDEEKPIRDAWRELQDHFAEWGRKDAKQRQADGNLNTERADDMIAELLVKMGNRLGYSFDKVYVKKGWYYPEGLSDVEAEQHAVRKGVLNVLSGQAKIPVAVFEQRFPPLTIPADVQPSKDLSAL